MKILHRKAFVLGTILLLAVGHCTARAKRDAETVPEENDLNLAGLADEVAKIPDIGPYLKDLLNYFGEWLMTMSQLLNSVIARILGGSLPCELDINDDITCSGASKNGGVFGIVEGIINDLVLPDIIKTLMINLIKRSANPLADALLGGLALPRTKKKTDVVPVGIVQDETSIELKQ